MPMVREKVDPKQQAEQATSSDYVYDVYYLNKADFDYRALENILAIEALKEEEYIYDDYRFVDYVDFNFIIIIIYMIY